MGSINATFSHPSPSHQTNIKLRSMATKKATAHFTPAALRFMKALKRNNDREWFAARKDVFITELQQPMLALIEHITHAMEDFAPAHLRPANKIAMRIYRDIRFSNDKRPYKENLGAWWARAGMEKTSGGGFYFHFSGKELLIAAGIYMPDRDQLLKLRRFIADDPDRVRKALDDKKLRRLMPNFHSNPLTRTPKGFPPDSPADDLLRCRQWEASVSLPAETVLEPTLAQEIITRFRAAAPLVELLNSPLVTKPRVKTFF